MTMTGTAPAAADVSGSVPDAAPEAYELHASRLEGAVRVSGAKNSALRLLAASLLTDERVTLQNFPAGLLDAQVHVGMLEVLGKRCTVTRASVVVDEDASAPPRLRWAGRSIRNTLLILGAMVGRTGRGAVPLPGGCAIGQDGDRKHDLHEMVLREMGARVWVEDGHLCAEAAAGLRGADIHLPIRSTGATENAILCAVLAKGITRIWNPHVRPEILDLIAFLRSMRARITVFGQEHIEVIGVERLSGTTHRVLPDNLEAITWLVGAAITGGEVEIFDFPRAHLEVPLIHLRESGVAYSVGSDSLVVHPGACYPVDVATGPYPGINSDMQPLFAVFGACARGESRVLDLRFPGRYGYAEELTALGVDCRVDGDVLRVLGTGGRDLRGTTTRARDLRAGAALAVAALRASGTTIVTDAWQIERGYDDFVGKLRALGGHVAVR